MTVDDGDLIVVEVFEVAVTQVNDVPVITSVAPASATEDIEYSYQVDVEDPDNSIFEFTLSDAPVGMVITPSGLITWTPLEGVTTSGVVTLTVDDGDLIAVEVFEVAVTQVNDVPVITSVAPVSATEDVEYSYQVDVEDPDNTNFEFTLDNAPDGMAVSDSGLILWTPLEGVTTSGVVTLFVDDGDLIAVEVFEVAVTQVNDVPVITSMLSTSATEDIEYGYRVMLKTQIILVLNLL